MNSAFFTAYLTITRREVIRFSKVWFRTLLPPMVNTGLYFLIFGNLIGQKIGPMSGCSYVEFMMPGLVMMSVIICSYTNVASSMYSARFQKYIEEILVSPVPMWLIVAGFITGGVIRGMTVGVLVLLVALNFTPVSFMYIHHLVLMLLLASLLFSLGGFINAIYARNFDDISVIPTLLLTPLIYLGGVFYTVEILPQFWENVSRINPLLYIINTFRYGFLGVSDTSIILSYLIVGALLFIFFVWATILLQKGRGLVS